ncbi:ATP-binding protein [Actinomadura nitritigenes]|uniref:ATP-binding protein n=1 Tax=Actinomadura nitritigenes TaxID=134602 RepID=A0ABS3QRA1_9ACTN|nr:ATP-binding protein [Actinomadura nitritigenes]MBO2436340.1 ATP-binding protein [Actinomadura nitritigenes]
MSAMAFAAEGPHTIVLEPNVHAPLLARRFLAACFAEWGIEDDHLGRLVVCELVTNAWRHGEGPIVVRLYLDARDGLPVVEVWDSGAGRPVVRPPDDGAVCGRGLLLVAGFVRGCWGVRPLNEGGKAVWAKLPRGEGE